MIYKDFNIQIIPLKEKWTFKILKNGIIYNPRQIADSKEKAEKMAINFLDKEFRKKEL